MAKKKRAAKRSAKKLRKISELQRLEAEVKQITLHELHFLYKFSGPLILLAGLLILIYANIAEGRAGSIFFYAYGFAVLLIGFITTFIHHLHIKS